MNQDLEKVFTGIIFDIYQRDHTASDGSIHRHEKAKRPDTVKIIGVDNNRILLAHDTFSAEEKIGLYGGKIRENETILECAARKMKEEGGKVFETYRIFGSYALGHHIHMNSHIVIARSLIQTVSRTTDNSVNLVDKWVTGEELISLITLNKTIFPHAFENHLLRVLLTHTKEEFLRIFFGQ